MVLDWLSYVVRIRIRPTDNGDVKTPTHLNVNNPLHLNNEETNALLEKFRLSAPNSPKWLERKLKGNHVINIGDSFPNINTTNINNRMLQSKYQFEVNEKVVSRLDVLINHLRSMEEEDAIRTEWRVVAMTIDRCLLILFTCVFLVTVIGCFCNAPGYVS